MLNWDLSDGMPGLSKMMAICHSMRYWLRLCHDRDQVATRTPTVREIAREGGSERASAGGREGWREGARMRGCEGARVRGGRGWERERTACRCGARVEAGAEVRTGMAGGGAREGRQERGRVAAAARQCDGAGGGGDAQVLVVLVNEFEDAGKARQMVLSGKARAALVYSCFRALDDFHQDFSDFGGGDEQAAMDAGFKKNTMVQQTLFEFCRKRHIKENEMEDMMQVPSFKRLANDFDVNIKAGVQNALPIVLMRIFCQRLDNGGGGVRQPGRHDRAQPSIPIFGEDETAGGGVVRGCRPVVEVVNQGRVVYSSLDGHAKPPFLDESEHDIMKFILHSPGTQGVSLLGDVMVTCYHVDIKAPDAHDGLALPGLPQHVYNDDTVDKKIIWRYCFHTGMVPNTLFRLHPRGPPPPPPRPCLSQPVLPWHLPLPRAAHAHCSPSLPRVLIRPLSACRASPLLLPARRRAWRHGGAAAT